MWQISYPLANGASLGSYFCVFDFSLKTLSKSGLNKPILPFLEEAHIVTDGQTDKFGGMWIFFFQLNFLPPYLLRWQGN